MQEGGNIEAGTTSPKIASLAVSLCSCCVRRLPNGARCRTLCTSVAGTGLQVDM